MRLRRGFKTEAHAIAREVRAELGLRTDAPLDPRALADLLDVPVAGLSELARTEPASVHQLSSLEPEAFSAVTVFRGTRRAIWHNDGHAPGRQASNIAHELAHALLLHEPGAGVDADGARDWDPVAEAEAGWLGPALLISDEAAIAIAREGTPHEDAARIYNVSLRLLRFRLGVTGAELRVARARRLS